MCKIPGGYVLLARKIMDSTLMDQPPLYIKLFMWMLAKANWKDREKLCRGQFVASIADMQEAMSYKIGYRKMTPTKDEIRSAYEAFAKATMITTAKTTRGMIITIVNFDTYQNPNNYEAHDEAHDENTAKPAVTPHHTEEGRRKRRKEDLKTSAPSDSSTPVPGVEEPLPSWLPRDAWDGFVSMRRSIKKPMSDYAKKLAVGQLSKLRDAGNDPAEVLNQSTMNSWKGLFEVKASKKTVVPMSSGDAIKKLLTPPR